jgi:hypothetical protein
MTRNRTSHLKGFAMKRISLTLGSAAFAFGCSAALATEPETPVAVDVSHLQPHVADQVIKHAGEGYRSLARYMERTRPYHRLWFDDVMRPQREVAPLDEKIASRPFRKHATEWVSTASR